VVSPEGVRDMGGFSSMKLDGGVRPDLSVFMTFPPPKVDAGDLVRAVGDVAMYKGTVEVLVEDAEDIQVVRRCQHPAADLGQVLKDPEAFDGREPIVAILVLTDATMDGTGEGWWFLATSPAQEDRTTVAVHGRTALDPSRVRPGEELKLRVEVRYDPWTGLVYLEAISTF
jgi:hypothetical protein